jgi:hypothetical protein
MAYEWAEKKRRQEGVTRSVVDEGAMTTSSTMMSSWTIFPSAEASADLLEYRSYVELALVLARLLSDVLSRTNSQHDDDILACRLVGDTEFAVRGLDEALRNRINKGSAVHLVNFQDPEHRQWRLPEISAWATGAVERFSVKLGEAEPELARWFDDEISRFRAEMAPNLKGV